MKSHDSDTFCILPWVGATVAPDKENIICCRAFGLTEYTLDSVNTTEHKILRKSLGEGVKHDTCRRCWNDEENGIDSYRQLYNERFSDLIASDTYSPPKLRMLEYTPSNVCNLACRMCSSKYSSRILAREKSLHSKGLWFETKSPEFTDWRKLDLAHIRELKLMGGEPMYMKDHLELLSFLDNNDQLKDINISLITNCTQKITQEWLYFLKKSNRAEITISIDAIGKLNDYIRQHSDWEIVESILKDFIKIRDETPTIHINVNSSISLLNINKTKKIKEYFHDLGVHLYFNPVYWPEHLSVPNTPEKIKKMIRNCDGVSEDLFFLLDSSPIFFNERDDYQRKNMQLRDETDKYCGKYLKDYNLEMWEILNAIEI